MSEEKPTTTRLKKKAADAQKSSGAFLSTTFNWSEDAPRNIDAETGVLASILMDESGHVLNECMAMKIMPEYFYSPKNVAIFSAMLELHVEGKAVDIVVLSEKLQSQGKLDKIGIDYIATDILGRVESITNFRQWLEILKEKFYLRKISKACVETLDKVRTNSGTIETLLGDVEKTFLGIQGDSVGDGIKKVDTDIESALLEIKEIIANKGEIKGILTGFTVLDKKLRGLHENEMIVIAGRPGTGKTSIALNIVENALFQNPPAPTLVFSLEMLSKQLYMRMIAARARVDQYMLGEGRLERGKMEDIMTTVKELKGAPLWIDDTEGLSILEMRAKARRLNQQLGGKLGLIVIDYLQLLKGSDPTKPREQEVAEISRGIKSMAKELKVPVIVLAQLNREADKGEYRPPRPSDLRESGSIEQDADSIILLSRRKNTDDAIASDRWVIRVDLAKNRHGSTGDSDLLFNRSYTRYENYLAKEEDSI